MLQAGTLVSYMIPPVAPISLAATVLPQIWDRFGAIKFILVSIYFKSNVLWLSISKTIWQPLKTFASNYCGNSLFWPEEPATFIVIIWCDVKIPLKSTLLKSTSLLILWTHWTYSMGFNKMFSNWENFYEYISVTVLWTRLILRNITKLDKWIKTPSRWW